MLKPLFQSFLSFCSRCLDTSFLNWRPTSRQNGEKLPRGSSFFLPTWFTRVICTSRYIDEGTYLRDYFDVNKEYYPSSGLSAKIYVAEIPNFNKAMKGIQAMATGLKDIKVDGRPSSFVGPSVPETFFFFKFRQKHPSEFERKRGFPRGSNHLYQYRGRNRLPHHCHHRRQI